MIGGASNDADLIGKIMTEMINSWDLTTETYESAKKPTTKLINHLEVNNKLPLDEDKSVFLLESNACQNPEPIARLDTKKIEGKR